MTTIGLELVPPFLAVAELGSFSAAAGRLGIEKSSVSRAVTRLEDAIGERLFSRTTRRVALTDAGQSMRDRLREPYSTLDAALRAHLDENRSPRGRVVLTAPPDFAVTILSDAVTRFGRRHPHVEVDVRISNHYVDLVAENIDAAVRLAARPLKDSGLRVRKLADSTLGMFGSRSLVEARGLPQNLDEANGLPWIGFRPMRELPVKGPDGAAAGKITMPGRLSCDDMGFMFQACLRGAGLAMLPFFLAETELREGRLVQILPRWTLPLVPMWFVMPGGQKPSRATDALRECISEVLATNPGFRVP